MHQYLIDNQKHFSLSFIYTLFLIYVKLLTISVKLRPREYIVQSFQQKWNKGVLSLKKHKKYEFNIFNKENVNLCP